MGQACVYRHVCGVLYNRAVLQDEDHLEPLEFQLQYYYGHVKACDASKSSFQTAYTGTQY